MSNSDIHFVHSGGIINKNPEFDLGGANSSFELAVVPVNNLFNDVPVGTIDYRCFYIVNKHINLTIRNCEVTVDDTIGGATVTFGSKIVNDVQKLVFMGTPDLLGYAIFDTEFGAPFTVTYDDDGPGGWTQYATNFKNQIRQQPFCSTVDVVWSAGPSSETNILTVTFNGEAGNRNNKLIRLIQNNMVKKDWGSYDAASYTSSDLYNGIGDTKIKVTRPINTEYVPSSGVIAVYNPGDQFGIWERLDYTNYSADIFDLAIPLSFDIIRGPDIEVIGLDDHQILIQITKETEGSPINSIAVPIDDSTDLPDFTEVVGTFSVGTLRPQEGFFLWIKRDANPIPPNPFLNDSFNLTFTGVAVNFPP